MFDDGKFDEWVKLPAKSGLSSHKEIHIIMNFTVRFLSEVIIWNYIYFLF